MKGVYIGDTCEAYFKILFFLPFSKEKRALTHNQIRQGTFINSSRRFSKSSSSCIFSQDINSIKRKLNSFSQEKKKIKVHSLIFLYTFVIISNFNTMQKFKLLAFYYVIVLLTSCASMKAPVINKITSLDDYKYFYITPTQELSSGFGATISGQYYSTTKTINPADVISGILIKQGYIKLLEIDKNKLKETFVINYGESGRRNVNLGYSIEITMQFISALDQSLICTATAEGQGETEADDIRIAINRALEALFKE